MKTTNRTDLPVHPGDGLNIETLPVVTTPGFESAPLFPAIEVDGPQVAKAAGRAAYTPLQDPFGNWRRLHTDFVLHKVKKAPGCDVNKDYQLRYFLSLVISLILVTYLFKVPLYRAEHVNLTVASQEVVQMEEIRQTRQEVVPPAPPRPPVPVEVPNDRIIEQEELDLDATLDINEPLGNIPPPPVPATPAKREEVREELVHEQEVFVVVEEMPELIGGVEALYSHVEYPEMARRAGLEGMVIVNFVVEPDGTPSNPEVVRSPSEMLSEAAVQAVMQVRFKPGKQRGKPVRVRYSVSIRFRLQA